MNRLIGSEEEHQMKRLPFLLFVSGLTGALFLGVFWAADVQANPVKTFTIDVACNGETAGVNFSDFNDPRANVIIVNGNIYPEGTLPSGDTDFDPTIPGDGVWRCHFAELGDIDFPLRGAVTYFFQFEPTGDGAEVGMIMVQGLNSHRPPPDSVPRTFAVVGGTGKYAGIVGEVREEVLGTNLSGCFNMRFSFKIRGLPGFKD